MQGEPSEPRPAPGAFRALLQEGTPRDRLPAVTTSGPFELRSEGLSQRMKAWESRKAYEAMMSGFPGETCSEYSFPSIRWTPGVLSPRSSGSITHRPPAPLGAHSKSSFISANAKQWPRAENKTVPQARPMTHPPCLSVPIPGPEGAGRGKSP